jgi:hypothetical protein
MASVRKSGAGPGKLNAASLSYGPAPELTLQVRQVLASLLPLHHDHEECCV